METVATIGDARLIAEPMMILTRRVRMTAPTAAIVVAAAAAAVLLVLVPVTMNRRGSRGVDDEGVNMGWMMIPPHRPIVAVVDVPPRTDTMTAVTMIAVVVGGVTGIILVTVEEETEGGGTTDGIETVVTTGEGTVIIATMKTNGTEEGSTVEVTIGTKINEGEDVAVGNGVVGVGVAAGRLGKVHDEVGGIIDWFG